MINRVNDIFHFCIPSCWGFPAIRHSFKYEIGSRFCEQNPICPSDIFLGEL